MNISDLVFSYRIAEPSELQPDKDDVCVLAYSSGVWIGALRMAGMAKDYAVANIDGRGWVMLEGIDIRQWGGSNVADVAILIHEKGNPLSAENWLHHALNELPAQEQEKGAA